MVQQRAARYVKNRHGNTSSVSDNWHAEHHELAKCTRQEERRQVVYDVPGRQESGCHHERQALSSTQENPALSHQSLPDTELQNRSKKELILPKDSSWLECASSRHHWRRVPGCFQSPGDNSDPLTNTIKQTKNNAEDHWLNRSCFSHLALAYRAKQGLADLGPISLKIVWRIFILNSLYFPILINYINTVSVWPNQSTSFGQCGKTGPVEKSSSVLAEFQVLIP